MTRLIRFAICQLTACLLAVTAGAVATLAWPCRAAEFTPSAAFLKANCLDCHTGPTAESGLKLDELSRDLSHPQALAKWVQSFDRIDRHEMPPNDHAQPAPADRTAFLADLRTHLTTASQSRAQTVIRRLNRAEYERTLNDLFGTRVSVVDMLPEDGRAFGFENIGEALDISPVQLQRYMEAAGKILDAAVTGGDPKPEPSLETYTFDSGRNAQFIGKHWLKRPDGAVVFFSEGNYPGIQVNEFRTRAEGRYRIRLHTAAYQSEKAVTYGVYLGGGSDSQPQSLFRHFDALPGEIRITEFEAWLGKGHSLRIFIRDIGSNNPSKDGIENYKGRGLAVAKMEVEGPFLDEWPRRGQTLRYGDLKIEDLGNPKHRKERWYKPSYGVVSDSPEADVARLIPPLVEAAFRRPVAPADVQPYIDLALAELTNGQKIDRALRTAQVAALTAPDFLYLIEPPASQNNGKLDSYAVASRLSYMLWGTGPDAELLSLARQGVLTKPETLRAQTERLLSDQRGRQFVKTFVAQWLNLREIDFTTPDRQLYPEFDDLLKQAMVDETELFFTEVLEKNRSLLEFVDSDWTFLNERLARHYGIAADDPRKIEGVEMRRVALKPADRRGGVLTQASVLKVSANGTTTSPVTRGAWVLERILGFTPPPPPPGVPGVEPDIRGAVTLREMLAKHRDNASCNQCHKTIDPPGFALESYDVIGGRRDNYRSVGDNFPRPTGAQAGGRNVRWRIGPAVDSSGQTADGQKFADLAEYKKILLADPQPIARALAVKLTTYGTGRGLEFCDRPEIDRITTAVAAKNYGFRDLIHEVIQSKLFLYK
jgi:hypothetical protein